MEPRKKKKIQWNYDEAAIQECLRCVKNKTLTIYGASKAYGVPQSTLRFRIGDKWSKKTRKGPPSIFSPEEESDIVDWLKDMERKGHPLVKESLMYKVKSILQANPRVTPFKDNMPGIYTYIFITFDAYETSSTLGRKWFQAFLQRNPSITIRTPEAVTAASAKVSEADIRGWFTRISEYFAERGLSRILQDPSRIYNGDETSFFLHPKTKAVLASVGSKNVYETEHANSHTNITVMFTFGADGSIIPPDVILPLKRIRPDILRAFPSEWGIGKSEKGWMDVPNFMLYVRNIMYPFLVRKGVTFPIIYYVDGHTSHMAAEVADLCLDLGIILVALYPNTTRITQPADVSIFKPLKNAWKSAVSKWRGENSGEILSLKYFAPVLQTGIERGIKTDSIVNGFRVCGLFPFCADNVDYSKCLAQAPSRPLDNPTVSSSSHPRDDIAAPTQEHFKTITSSIFVTSAVILPSACVRKAIDTIGEERLHKLNTANTLTEEETVIRSLYHDLLKPVHGQACFNNPNSTPVRTSNRMDEENCQRMDEECQLSNIENGPFGAGAIVIEPLENSNVDLRNVEVIGEYSVNEATGELMELDQSECTAANETSFVSPTLNFRDTGVANASTEPVEAGRRMKTSISSFLQTPLTPRRSGTHRNYKNKYHPVLTAGERLDELRRLEQEKENEILRKAERGRKREETRKELEMVKQMKAEAREQKRRQAILKKEERESLRKIRTVKAQEQKKQKQELLETLKLKEEAKKRMR